ncbi:MAG TPA: glycosyltransferase family 2 protein [Chloroflexota bacterium]|nr:glycosyltransferase family 2 protein [Chloroflexota bacterium]
MTALKPASREATFPPATASPVTPPFPPVATDVAARLSVIVPVYNERNTLRELLNRVRTQKLLWQGLPIELELVVVDDCSNDGSVDFLELEESRRSFPEVRLIRHTTNRGKGAAIRTGLAHASGSVVLIQDADLEYDPADYARLVAPILEGKTRVVYGSRFKSHGWLSRLPGMHPANWLANKILSLTASALFFTNVTDEATCYKVLDRRLIDELDLRANRFDFCPEVTSKVLRRGHQILEVPISYHGRGSNQGKKIRWTDAFHAWWTLVRYRFSE